MRIRDFIIFGALTLVFAQEAKCQDLSTYNKPLEELVLSDLEFMLDRYESGEDVVFLEERLYELSKVVKASQKYNDYPYKEIVDSFIRDSDIGKFLPSIFFVPRALEEESKLIYPELSRDMHVFSSVANSMDYYINLTETMPIRMFSLHRLHNMRKDLGKLLFHVEAHCYRNVSDIIYPMPYCIYVKNNLEKMITLLEKVYTFQNLNRKIEAFEVILEKQFSMLSFDDLISVFNAVIDLKDILDTRKSEENIEFLQNAYDFIINLKSYLEEKRDNALDGVIHSDAALDEYLFVNYNALLDDYIYKDSFIELIIFLDKILVELISYSEE